MLIVKVGPRYLNMDTVINVRDIGPNILEVTYLSAHTERVEGEAASALRAWLDQVAVDVAGEVAVWTDPVVTGPQTKQSRAVVEEDDDIPF